MDRSQKIFHYDDPEDFLYLKRLFERANADFLRLDPDLIESDVSEQTLCGALKTRLEKKLNAAGICDYYVDLEYNRNNGKIKTVIEEDCRIVNIKCDFILHSRGHNVLQDNLLALEMKKSYRPEREKDADRDRLIALTKSTYDHDIWSFDGKTFPEHVCRYIIGIYYELDADNRRISLEFYRQGQLVSKTTRRLDPVSRRLNK